LNPQHAAMNSLTKTRRATLAKRYSFLLPAVLVAMPVPAQQPRDSVVARTVSTFQRDVDRLKQELIIQRNIELALLQMFAEVEMRRKSGAVPDSLRFELQAQSQLVLGKMREASQEQVKLRRRIETLCATVRMPEGWLGVATTGVQLQDKRSDGTTFIRFLEPPVIASVDPGSPADRVGVRAGDVLVEIGGYRVLGSSIVFAELLRPGRAITLKLRRGDDTVTLVPTVEPIPNVTTTPCAMVDPATAYVVAPMPAQAPNFVRVETGPSGERKYAYGFATARKDSSAVARAVPSTAGAVYAGPMVGLYGGGLNSLAGVQLMALSTESSQRLGLANGILVNQVLPGTPGHEAGLQGGDILVSADSVQLRSIRQLQTVINRASDRVVTLVIVRDKKRETVQLRW
jgi:membrane-associated protease RseP (regulator of RpoE activity)